MKFTSFSERMWGRQARFFYLLAASVLIVFAFLGTRELWTQEHRWADIVSGMFFRHDFLHPYLGQSTYYDKPLLSYWLIVLFVKLTGTLSTWTLRLPSAFAGLLAIWSIYRLGSRLENRALGLLSGWILLTTFCFVFWARTSSADMLNMAGTLFAIAWYMDRRDNAGFFSYAIFFLIVALTSLCKGLGGAIVPFIAVFIDICIQKSWRKHLRFSLFLSVIPALIVYLLPFWASSHFGGEQYGQDGLYLVYRENILRYFKPFDHEGPIYTYFIYLPIYLLPWTFFFVPALCFVFKRFKTFTPTIKWLWWTFFAVFAFFTLSGSRRSYYVLPIVPFAVLITAEWILSSAALMKRRGIVTGYIIFSYILLFTVIDILPAWYSSQYGAEKFANLVKTEAGKIQPWQNWKIVTLDAQTKVNFYLNLPPNNEAYFISGTKRQIQNTRTLLTEWPIIKNKPANTIFITRKLYVPYLEPYFSNYQKIDLWQNNRHTWMPEDENSLVAFIPQPAKNSKK